VIPVNASASSLDREVEVQSEIRKVRTFGRTARIVCRMLFGLSSVGGVFLLPAVVLGPNAHLMTPQLKAWAFLIVCLVAGAWLAGVYQLYRLFGNLAAGAIYTPENVRRVRLVGLLCLLWAVLGIAIPSVSAVLIRIGFLGDTGPLKSLLVFPWSQSLSSAVSAGLVLLVSWIMDVGLYAKDHADALQRDADLVI
jgi:hypothetical protein